MRHPNGIIQLVRQRLTGRSTCCGLDGPRLPVLDRGWWDHVRF